MDKMEILKELESLVAFQTACLQEGRWEEYDSTTERIKKLEKEILQEQKTAS